MHELSPYIPLSWLRQQRKWAKEHVQNNCLDSYDLWLLTVRQEIDRLVIKDLHRRLYLARIGESEK